MNNRTVRRACGWSLAKTAALAGVGPTSIRIFEIDPNEVKDRAKRRRLRILYSALRVCVGVCSQ
jgi:hypothetical protein